MITYDFFYPEVFLNADRALQRMEIINAFSSLNFSIKNTVVFFTNYGIIGDYIFHLIIFSFLGQYGVIILHVFLLFVSLICIFNLVKTVTKCERTAFFTILLYFHLPHSLVLPHQLSSEGIFIPLLIISFSTLTCYIYKGEKTTELLYSGLFIGIATLIRPVTLLWPLITAGVLCLSNNFVPRKRITYYLAVAFLPLFTWMTFMLLVTGQFTMGSSNHDLRNNLTNRFKYMINSLPLEEQVNLRSEYLGGSSQEKVLITVGNYMRFSFNHFDIYSDHLIRDFIVIFGKSGINRFLLDYFQFDMKLRRKLRDQWKGWRTIWKSKGFLKTIEYMYKENKLIMIVNIVASIFCTGLSLFFVAGLVLFLKDSEILFQIRILYVLFPIYIFSVSQVVKRMSSRHRCPYEFIVAFIVVYCAKKLIDYLLIAIHGRKATSLLVE